MYKITTLVSVIIGLLWAVIQWVTPSLESTLLGLTRDFIASFELPNYFAFPLLSLLDIFGVMLIFAVMLTFIKCLRIL